jgi:hypothetical protein
LDTVSLVGGNRKEGGENMDIKKIQEEAKKMGFQLSKVADADCLRVGGDVDDVEIDDYVVVPVGYPERVVVLVERDGMFAFKRDGWAPKPGDKYNPRYAVTPFADPESAWEDFIYRQADLYEKSD